MRKAGKRWGQLGHVAFYLVIAWLALGTFIAALPWQPENPFMQSGRLFLLATSAVVTAIGLLGVCWAFIWKPSDAESPTA
jgi:hypothetical protein